MKELPKVPGEPNLPTSIGLLLMIDGGFFLDSEPSTLLRELLLFNRLEFTISSSLINSIFAIDKQMR